LKSVPPRDLKSVPLWTIEHRLCQQSIFLIINAIRAFGGGEAGAHEDGMPGMGQAMPLMG